MRLKRPPPRGEEPHRAEIEQRRLARPRAAPASSLPISGPLAPGASARPDRATRMNDAHSRNNGPRGRNCEGWLSDDSMSITAASLSRVSASVTGGRGPSAQAAQVGGCRQAPQRPGRTLQARARWGKNITKAPSTRRGSRSPRSRTVPPRSADTALGRILPPMPAGKAHSMGHCPHARDTEGHPFRTLSAATRARTTSDQRRKPTRSPPPPHALGPSHVPTAALAVHAGRSGIAAKQTPRVANPTPP